MDRQQAGGLAGRGRCVCRDLGCIGAGVREPGLQSGQEACQERGEQVRSILQRQEVPGSPLALEAAWPREEQAPGPEVAPLTSGHGCVPTWQDRVVVFIVLAGLLPRNRAVLSGKVMMSLLGELLTPGTGKAGYAEGCAGYSVSSMLTTHDLRRCELL